MEPFCLLPNLVFSVLEPDQMLAKGGNPKAPQTPVAGAERRRWQRLPMALPVFVRGKDLRGQDFKDFTAALNVSSGGMLLVMRRYLPIRTRISIDVPTPPLLSGGKGFPRCRQQLKARLVSFVPREPFHLYGVKFSRPLLGLPRAGFGGKKVSAK